MGEGKGTIIIINNKRTSYKRRRGVPWERGRESVYI